MEQRIYDLREMEHFSDSPQKVAIYETDKTLAVMWCLEPEQEVFLHTHPNADDVWIILEGEGLYSQGNGETAEINKSMAVLAKAGQVHGMRNIGCGRFVFVGVAAPVPIEIHRMQHDS